MFHIHRPWNLGLVIVIIGSLALAGCASGEDDVMQDTLIGAGLGAG